MSQDLIYNAVQCFGAKMIREILDIVDVSDADCAYTYYMEVGKLEHAECVEMLFLSQK